MDGVSFDAAVCSDLKRARRTAELLMASGCAARGARLEADPRLRECGLGEFEGKTKDEVYGPGYAALWARLGSLGHEVRVRTPYFAGLEAPLGVGARAAEALVDAALGAGPAPGGGPATVLAVTHSTVIESLLAGLFGADFESVGTKNLAWVRLRLGRSGCRSAWRLELDGSDGVEWRPSPDAVVLDPSPATAALGAGALGLVPVRTAAAAAGAAAPSGGGSRGLLRLMAAAFVLGTAGVVLIVATGGKIGASPVAAGAPGVWGPVTATVDWCEENYAVSALVAEPLNSASSLLLSAAGAWAALQARRAGAEARYAGLGLVLVLVGLGSAAFHATLRKEEQALDEIPMLWVALLAAYCILQVPLPKAPLRCPL